MKPRKLEKHPENLLVDVTEAVRMDRAKSMSKLIIERDRVVERGKEAASAARSEAKELTTKITEFNDVVNTGKEFHAVECETRPNLKLKTLEIWRLDTGTKVRDRPMSAEEVSIYRQTKLDLTKNPPKGDEKKPKKPGDWVDAIQGKVAEGMTVEKTGRKFKVTNKDGSEAFKCTSMKALLEWLGSKDNTPF